MMPLFIKKLFAYNKQLILDEVVKIRGFMRLLMKKRNTGIEWTKYELAKIKLFIKKISRIWPIFIIFLLPCGLLLLALLALFLERRKRKRHKSENNL